MAGGRPPRKREEWREVVGSPGYQVSSHGRVRSPRGRILKPQTTNRGYLRLHLGRKRREHVHKLVLEAFVPFRPVGACVDHRDHDRTNNRVENLRWLTGDLNKVVWNGRTADGRNIWTTYADLDPPEDFEWMTEEEQAVALAHLRSAWSE